MTRMDSGGLARSSVDAMPSSASGHRPGHRLCQPACARGPHGDCVRTLHSCGGCAAASRVKPWSSSSTESHPQGSPPTFFAEHPLWRPGQGRMRLLRIDRAAVARHSYLSAVAALRGRISDHDGATSERGAAAAVSSVGMADWERWLLYLVAVLFVVTMWRWMP